MPTVKFAVPKGSIEEVTFKLLEQAWQSVSGRGRTYRVKLGDPEIDVKILRPQEIPTYIQEGFYDVGITGRDWILEAKANVEILLDLEIGRHAAHARDGAIGPEHETAQERHGEAG